jgi:hypothetical protein
MLFWQALRQGGISLSKPFGIMLFWQALFSKLREFLTTIAVIMIFIIDHS